MNFEKSGNSTNIDPSQESVNHQQLQQLDKMEDLKLSGSNSGNEVLYLGFTKKHIKIIALYGIANIFRAAVVLIGGPFFPPEADSRGVTSTEIGIIFAAQDFTVFFMSLLYGKKIMNTVGAQNVVSISFFGIGVCAILFGCLAFIEDRILFVVLSILVRVLTGIFDGGIYPSVFTIYSIETPGSISTAIAIFEVFFGIGAIGGPVLCGILLEAVGFTLVYVTVGSCIIVSAVVILLFVPKVEHSTPPNPLHYEVTSATRTQIHNPGFLRLLSIPTVLLVIFSLFTAAGSIGFITATLALHYAYLTPRMSGALFSSGTAIYTFVCPMWGYAADRGLISKFTIMVAAAFIIMIGFSFLGPLPFLPYKTATWAGFVGYAIHGIGIGGSIMTAYHHALEAAVVEGFPDTSETYGLVSSVYIATFALGNTVGSTISGILDDTVGFRWGTIFIIGLALLVITAAILLRCWQDRKRIRTMSS